jgi:U3 small nucleolar RNA-associated protein 12
MSHDMQILAAGYSDGAIRLWDVKSKQSLVTLNGHKAAVTSLKFDCDSQKLASGSKDTDIILWDVVAESGICRFKGHKDQITGLVFLSKNGLNHLVSTSKDTLLKVWDLSTQHCVETIIAHRSEVWAIDCLPDESLLLTAATDQEVRVWNVESDVLVNKLNPVSTVTDSDKSNEPGQIQAGITLRGKLERVSKERSTTLKVHESGNLFGVQGADRMIEFFKILSKDEIKKKLARKKRRQKEKLKKDGKSTDTADLSLLEEVQTVADEINAGSIIRCSAKIRSFVFSNSAVKSSKEFSVVASLTNNSVESHQFDPHVVEEGVKMISSVQLHGHRSDVRAVALSSDDDMLVSGSNGTLFLADC